MNTENFVPADVPVVAEPVALPSRAELRREQEDAAPVESGREPLPIFETPPSIKPKYFVAGSTFFAQMEDGWELAVPIKLSTKMVRSLRDFGNESSDELDQLLELFRMLGNESVVERLEENDFLDSMEAAMKYFQAWEEKNEARLGELQRSSR